MCHFLPYSYGLGQILHYSILPKTVEYGRNMEEIISNFQSLCSLGESPDVCVAPGRRQPRRFQSGANIPDAGWRLDVRRRAGDMQADPEGVWAPGLGLGHDGTSI